MAFNAIKMNVFGNYGKKVNEYVEKDQAIGR